jgi:dTMP kinase
MTLRFQRPVLVVFEGLDGTGKTTAARRTAALIDAIYITTPSSALRAHRDQIIESLGPCQEARQLFYLSTVFAAADEARKLLDGGRSVVVDRYFLSTQAYAGFRGSKLDLDGLGKMLLPADLTVLLEAPLAVRRDRVAARGGSAADGETLLPLADARLREEHAARFDGPAIGRLLCIDASSTLPENIALRVAAEAAAVAMKP